MALACTWGGFAESGIPFSSFFGKNHTIAIRFLMQYPIGYAGSFLSVHGSGKYFVGQGDFKSLGISPPGGHGVQVPGITNLLIVIGTEFINHRVSDHGWHHVALVRTGNQMQLFIDGDPIRPMTIPADDLPDGTLRFGHSGFPLPTGVGGQFYGFLDDFALFEGALPAAEIKQLADAKRLTGDEPHLHIGYVFRPARPSSLPKKLQRPLEVSPAAVLHEVSDSRNAAIDLPKMHMPLNSPMQLPFAPGDVWRVTQGYNNVLSHNGYAAFCWDLVRDGAINGSEGETIYSASAGVVRAVQQGFSSPTDNINFVSVLQAHGESCDYIHIQKDSALVSRGDKVSVGTPLARVGDVGAAEGAYHLHLALSNGQPSGPKFFTIPAAFSNYDVEVDGEWKRRARSIPQNGQRIRRPPA